jgi:cytoskeletal protein CcmA (bactofilin family)
MGAVTINGKTYRGNSITVINDRVIIDGKEVSEASEDTLTISKVEGPIVLECHKALVIKGNVKGDIDARGSVTCEDVEGDIRSDGSVSCGDVSGSVFASGSVNCDDVGADVSAGGSINCDDVYGKTNK